MVASTRQPTYRKHKPSGQAVVTLNGKDFYLGVHGTQSSKTEYDRLIAEWLVAGRQIPANALNLAEILRQFWQWVETHYRKPDGSQTSEVCQFRYSLRPLNHLYGTLPAADFGPLKLKTVRQLMIEGYEHPRYGWQGPCSRDVINKRINRIKLMFKWASENELSPAAVYHSLLTVRGLQRGRTPAKETGPVRPVSDSIIQATRPFLSTPVRAMVDLQLLTGARPGEVCSMRACDFDITGPIWIYRPESHKNAYRQQTREVYLGPRAQEIVKAFFRSDLQAYLFSPRDAEAERQLARREGRKTPLFPSHLRRLEQQRKQSRKRAIRDHYDVASYRRAIAYACSKAFPLPEKFGPALKPDGKRETGKEWKARLSAQMKSAIFAWKREHFWHPHQLRHNAATNLRKQFGVELARIILGHATAFTTEIYAEADRQHAMDVIGKVG